MSSMAPPATPRGRPRRLRLVAAGATAVALLALAITGARPGEWIDVGRPLDALSATARSLSLAFAGLAIATALAAPLAGAAACSTELAAIHRAAIAASAVPLVAVAALARAVTGDSFWAGSTALGVAELGLGSIAARFRGALAEELTRPHAHAIRQAGRHPWRTVLRPCAAAAASAIRHRLAIALGGAIVVERMFGGEGGLAALLLARGEHGGDRLALAWVILCATGAMRGIALLEQRLHRLLVGGAAAPAPADGPAPWARASCRSVTRDAAAAARQLAAAVLALPARSRRAATATWRFVCEATPLQHAIALTIATAMAVSALLALLAAAGWMPAREDSLPLNAPPHFDAGTYLGTGGTGRDLLAQVLRGLRNTAGPMAAAVAITATLGIASATWVRTGTGAARSAARRAMTWARDVPPLLIGLAAAWAIPADGGYLWKLFAAIGLAHWPIAHAVLDAHLGRLWAAGVLDGQLALGATRWRAIGIHAGWIHGRGLLVGLFALLLTHVVATELALGYLGQAQPDDELLSWGWLARIGLLEATASPWSAIAPLGCAAIACIAVGWWAEPGLRAEASR